MRKEKGSEMRGKFYKKAQVMRDESGATAVVVALIFVVILGFVALTVDFGNYYSKQNRLQTACDAAALAAAAYLPDDTVAAQNEAKRLMKENGYDITNSNVTFSNGNRTVQVKKQSNVKTIFAQIFNINDMKTVKSSKATKKSAKVKFRLDYALYSGSTTKYIPVNGAISVFGGNVHTNHSVNYKSVEEGGLGANSFYVEKEFSSINGEENVGEAIQRPTNTSIVEETIPMPDYDESIMSVLPQDYSIYTSIEDYKSKNSVLYDAASGVLTIKDNVKITSSIECNDKLNITGNVLIVGSAKFKKQVTIGSLAGAGSLYVQGDETVFEQPVALNGYLVCDKSITFKDITTGIDNWKQSVIYAKSGNVRFEGAANSTVYGMIYIPDGQFYVKKGNTMFINGGGLIAESIDYNSGSIYINSDSTGSVKWDDKMTMTSPGISGGVQLVE